MSAGVCFELAVVVTERPGINFVARCNNSTATCTHSAKVAAARAALAALRKSGRLSGEPEQRRLSVLRAGGAGGRHTFTATYDVESEVAA